LNLPGLAPNPDFGQATTDGTALVTVHTEFTTDEKGNPFKKGVVQLHRLDRPSEPVTLRNRPLVTEVAIRPDGRQFAVADVNGMVRVYDSSGAEQFICGQLNRFFARLAYSRDNRMLAVGGYQPDTLKVWDAMTGQVVRTLDGLPFLMTGIKFTPDNRRLAIWSDRAITLRDLETGLDTLSVQAPDVVSRVEFTDESCGLVSTDGHETRYWDGRPALLADWLHRVHAAFRVRNLTVDPVVAAGQPLTVRLHLTNVSGHPFQLPPDGWLDQVLFFPLSVQAVLPVRVGNQDGIRVPYSEQWYPVVKQTVAADGSVEVVRTIPTASWPPGQYYLNLVEPHRTRAEQPASAHRVNFEVR
jgi:hypothetical protein